MTALADIMWTLLTTVDDALVACGAAAEDSIEMYRYNCQPPDDCCAEAGTLTAWWSSMGHIPAPAGRGKCTSKQQATVNVRFMRCWPCPDAEGALPPIAVQDAAGEAMADDAQCALAALLSLSCNSPCGDLDVLDLSPVCPKACCSGWVARVVVHPTPPSQEAT